MSSIARTATKALRTPRSLSLVSSFLARESPSSLASGAASPTPFDATSNPFAPTKTAGANSWTAPKYSIRRQKVLVKEVERLGWSLDCLPVAPVRAPSAKQAARAKTLTPFKASAHIPATKVLDELELEKRGPYTGRGGNAFKGKIWERKSAARALELRTALEGADAREAAWRKVSCRRVLVIRRLY